ncbi:MULTISPECIES: protoporphyrinogen oxidase HemJ [unclassified Devosia]|uniref:protoporphyrinogen oxidase HemJ n=1 Tax=unclassified Devosia TaxID=196773 RepID=UPI00145EA750|nr:MULTISPECIES: protoporphyrinogen oxidase HemJ [unclassified Devosia]MBJ6988579.1 protoporphyrinogen oxidase HemJ [Devosia sp. MC521]QMW62618.1 protoporphyrinogen oxidase HemJ [Devosia sp. MC521]
MLEMWVKALHVISVICWMAGMFYLPRLFVYHTKVAVGSEQSEMFKVMERRLFRAITTPAMIASWIFGLWMIHLGLMDFSTGWTWIKLVAVLGMSACHGILAKQLKAFAQDKNTKSEKFYRVINEVPTVLMLIIVIMVVVKPF